jgi:hypothetical protein
MEVGGGIAILLGKMKHPIPYNQPNLRKKERFGWLFLWQEAKCFLQKIFTHHCHTIS